MPSINPNPAPATHSSHRRRGRVRLMRRELLERGSTRGPLRIPMRLRSVLIILTMLATGCGSIPTLVQQSPNEVSSTLAATNAASIEEAFAAKSVSLDARRVEVSVVPGEMPVVSLNNVKLLAVPVINNGSKPRNMKVRSYVVRHGDGTHVLFYPIVSFIDKSYRAYETVEPKYEFAFDGNSLLNEFQIPMGVERLLVHTAPQYFRSSFAASTSAGETPKEAYGVAGVLGGAVGVVLVHAVTTPKSSREFAFGEIGLLNIDED